MFTKKSVKIGLINVGGKLMPINPYKPGAGYIPNYLAGRDAVISEAQNIADTLLSMDCGRFTIYYGLRGVGKTVLLNHIEELMSSQNIITVSFECTENKDFNVRLVTAIESIYTQISVFEKIKGEFYNIKQLLKALEITWSTGSKVEENNFSLGLTPEKIQIQKSTALTDILLALGKTARENNKSICIFVDEMQYMNNADFGVLMEALHKVAQKSLPIGFLGAGLPKILRIASEIKSYAERLFEFVHIDTLKKADAIKALTEPAVQQGVFYEDDAVEQILNVTEGYPYFIQEYGKQVWFKQNDKKIITKEMVVESYQAFIDKLDESFFKARLDRATPTEKNFMCTMVFCGNLPCSIADVANHLNKKVESISPTRGQLINKGFIYDTSYGMIDFTVPQFDKYLKRVYPDL